MAQTLNDLGALAAEKGDYDTAAASLDAALSIRRHIFGPVHTDVADTLAELGRVYQDHGLNARAEPLHREALAIRQQALGDEHGETAVSMSDLASVLRLNGDLDGAEMMFLDARNAGAAIPARRSRARTGAAGTPYAHEAKEHARRRRPCS